MNLIGVQASVLYIACKDCTYAVVVPNIVINEVCANGDVWHAASSDIAAAHFAALNCPPYVSV